MRSELGDKIRLKHILDAILEIEVYISGVDFSLFMENSMMRCPLGELKKDGLKFSMIIFF